MSKMSEIIVSTFIMLMIAVIGIYLGQAIIANQTNQFNLYAHAPDCNGTIPQTEGVCKWSNRTWLLCEKPVLSDEHLKNTVWCKPVELYDVRT